MTQEAKETVERQPALPKEVGHKLVEVAENVLTENLGRAPGPQELADMAETMVAELLSGGYITMRSAAGPKEAEAWLRKVLAMAATFVRMSGSDAFLKLDVVVHEMPNNIAPKGPPPPGVPVPPAPPQPCECEKGKDGRCAECCRKLAKAYKEFFGHFQKAAQFKDVLKGMCLSCEREQLDRAVSSIVDSLFTAPEMYDDDKKATYAQDLLTLLHQMAFMAGVQEMPLTVAAWKAAAVAKGLQIEEG